MNLQNRKRLTDLKSELIIAGKGRESYQVWDGHVHTAIFKMDNQQGPTVQHVELSSMLCGSRNGSRVWGSSINIYGSIYMYGYVPSLFT